MENPVIVFDNVSFAYEGAEPVLRNLTLEVAAGEFVALVGPNGCGKSTVAQLMDALLLPSAGEVRVCDVPTAAKPQEAHRHVALVFQDPADMSVASSVEADVAFGPENLGLSCEEAAARVAEALAQVNASDLAKREIASLSGGQQQRVAIAGGLAMHPDVLVLDEPTSMLDATAREQLLALLRRLADAGMAIVLITHNAADAEAADRVIRLGEEPEQARAAEPHAPCCAKPGAEVLLRVDDVSFAYDEAPVLENVSLEVQAGECVGVYGSNGCGKSTLLKLMNALLLPDAGAVVACGADTRAKKTRKQVRQRVGLVFQRPELQLFASTVIDDVMFGPRNCGCNRDEARARALEALAALGLDAERLAEQNPFRLSGGQQRLVAIAGVVAMQPQVLALDEPFAGLDALGCEAVRSLVRSHCAAGGATVLVSHDPAELESLCAHVFQL